MRVIHMLIACVTAASASNNGYLEKLLKRQEPGTPQYDCHAACGGVIRASRMQGFCDTDPFKADFDSCMSCAEVYNIWQYYGASVTRAATTCGLQVNLTPAPSNSTSGSAPSSSSAASTTGTISESTASPTSGTSTGSIQSTISSATATSGTGTVASAASSTSSSPAAASSTGAAAKLTAGQALMGMWAWMVALVLL